MRKLMRMNEGDCERRKCERNRLHRLISLWISVDNEVTYPEMQWQTCQRIHSSRRKMQRPLSSERRVRVRTIRCAARQTGGPRSYLPRKSVVDHQVIQKLQEDRVLAPYRFVATDRHSQ